MTYPEAVAYLESFTNYELLSSYSYNESLKLERIRDFLNCLDNPQDSLPCIHIAGTKGKGSACAFVAYILRQAGFKVGLYTSPHLSDLRERIRILLPENLQPQIQSRDFEGMILKHEMLRLVERLKARIDYFSLNSKHSPLTFFEIYTALTFLYFKEQKVDFAVLETGLGGRLDATNVVNPLICGIAPISLEHTQQLGNSISEIAAEKAGIIKDQAKIVISAPQKKEAELAIKKKCKQHNVRLYRVGNDINFEKSTSCQEGSIFNLRTASGEYQDLKIKLLGRHQIINASLAVGIVEALKEKGIFINLDGVKDGLYNTLWPARLEILSDNPKLVIDGAQNVASADVLKQAIEENFPYERLILVLGISQDKDIKGICGKLFKLADEVILTKANTPRAANPIWMKDMIAELASGVNIQLSSCVEEALNLARKKAGLQDLILITGSLFVAGEARKLIKERLICTTH
jgi:dihydrofolate synthase/folylpolyglutamate synthase